jgi:hypothetical protein
MILLLIFLTPRDHRNNRNPHVQDLLKLKFITLRADDETSIFANPEAMHETPLIVLRAPRPPNTGIRICSWDQQIEPISKLK